ncbi:hypothetical protein [Nostoc sp. TCL26-01]|uniref:hypothetical protein n=1 Tax=Nostoc sp. TCL26-01 TaxID=2576904 RepID=UPI0015BA87C9|nr:hypothetical protein [Nostoc sp. TCL26-01]QLE56041.1 hypothetical protein FD725_11200 [Nostoc sp. TCL26-01]
MFIILFHLRRGIDVLILTFFLTNILAIRRVEAKAQENLDNYPDTNSVNSAEKDDLGNFNFQPITQNSTPNPARLFPNVNEIDIPEILSPSQNPSFTPNEIERIEQEFIHHQHINPITQARDKQESSLNALTNSHIKYPWIVEPIDKFNFYNLSFNPLKNTNYLDFSLKFTAEEPIINEFNFAHFPKQDQLYWILPSNRIVIETQGWDSGISYQGESTNIEYKDSIRLSQGFWGMQAVSSLPQAFTELTGETDFNKFTIQSTAAEIINPTGLPTPSIVINPQIASFSNDFTQPGNRDVLDIDNTPLILQAFPTSNLQPLLGGVSLNYGTLIPRENLAKAGFFWGNPLTRQANPFQPQITSKPGIKVGRVEQFDNSDLLNILLNTSLSRNQRDLYYLNSLFWIPLTQRQTNVISRDQKESYHWQRFYFSHPHNRTLLQYDDLKPTATYTNIYSNPGVSLSLSVNQREIDEIQSANATLGMLMGGAFELINIQMLTQSLQEAKERYSRQENFAPIDSKTTPEQRRQINQVLNRTIFLSNINSGLEQVSGKLTFPSKITTNSSSLFQIRTGNHRRAVQFIDGNRQWQEGETFISKTQISNQRFGRLSFVGAPIPLDQTSVRSNNRSLALQVNLISPNGQQFVQNFNSVDMTVVPINVRSFDIAFDHIELSQVGQINTQLQVFNGYIFLPTIEGVWAGSTGKWNYSINSGVWFNLNADAAFNVANNNFGLPEPTLGVYANGALNFINSYEERDREGKIQVIVNHIPAIRFYWSSAVNSQNPAYLNMSYFFSRQSRDLNYSLSTALVLINDQRHITPAGFFQGKLGLSSGLEFSTSVEISDQFFYALEGIKQLNSHWFFGGYLQNYRSSNQGIQSRINDFSYGLLIKHDLLGRGSFWESRIGMSGDAFEASLKGGLQF